MNDTDSEEMRSSDTSLLPAITDRIIDRLEALNTARDVALTLGRQVVRLSANAVRSLHRDEHDAAMLLLTDARDLLVRVKSVTAPHPSLYWAGYVQDAMREFAEASITATLLGNAPLPPPEVLQIEDAPYLNALAEAASELRRDTLDALRADDVDRAVDLLRRMDDIYAVLVTVDYPDAVTGGLRRTTDQLRAVLERTRGDVTVAVRQHRLERALARVERATERTL